jgi:hypothetical protein
LEKEIQELKERMVVLFLEQDNLLYHQCPQIKADYMVKIGAFEYKIFEMECNILKSKRKIELIQLKINRQEMVVLSFIELQLDEEYKKWDEQLKIKMAEVDEALKVRSNTTVLSDEDSAEVKILYTQLIKKLHPDFTPKSLKLFHATVEAYKSGDLPTLRSIKLLSGDMAEKTNEYNSLEIMKQTRDTYKDGVAKLETEIKKMRDTFPYNMRSLICDDIKVKELQEEFALRIEQNEVSYKGLENRLTLLLSGTYG